MRSEPVRSPARAAAALLIELPLTAVTGALVRQHLVLPAILGLVGMVAVAVVALRKPNEHVSDQVD